MTFKTRNCGQHTGKPYTPWVLCDLKGKRVNLGNPGSCQYQNCVDSR
jgi:hypothetical protein